MSFSLIQKLDNQSTRNLINDSRLEENEKMMITHDKSDKPLPSVSRSHKCTYSVN